ncbi:LLM class flavin-dependent oxidoreductase [Phycicoccus sp. CMS6Z-2]|nr:LLM class flavin-dependent oxidoreductase [Phycicoccus flavus]
MRHGVCLLTDLPWREAAPRWRAVEELGFDHGWTYDHLVWGGLPESPWRSALPTLAAAAGLTTRLGLGTFVSSPNQNHPYTYAREVVTLDDLSDGRFLCGVGTGGDLDSRLLGGDLTLGQRVERFHEFVPLLRRLLTEDHVDHDGAWYTTRDARTLPGPTRPPIPLLVAANGPRSVRLAARYGDGWVTYGAGGDTTDEWWAGVTDRVARFDNALHASGRGPVDRYLSLDASPRFSLESAGLYAEMAGRAGELGFTDVVCHWPRPDGPYAGDPAVLEEVAGSLRG